MEANQFASVNHTWTLVLDGFILKRAKQTLGLNLFRSVEDFEGFMNHFSDNPDVYIDLLWIICEEQAVKRNLNEVQFAQEFRGGSLMRSTDAFMIAIADFFQNDQLTRAVSLIVGERIRLREAATEEMREVVSQAIEDSKQQTTTTDSSSKSQESSESTQISEASVN